MTTMEDNTLFLDTNTLVYAHVREAPLHSAALDAIRSQYDAGCELWVSNQILREFLATLSRPQMFSKPVSMAALIDRIRFFQERFRVAEETTQVTERLLELLEQFPTGGRQVHDANIVATMQVYGINRLLTRNVQDFERFSSLIDLIPLEG